MNAMIMEQGVIVMIMTAVVLVMVRVLALVVMMLKVYNINVDGNIEGHRVRNSSVGGERKSTGAVDGLLDDATLAVASMSLESKMEDKMETSEDDGIDKFCDLTAIYENQVFVVLDKNEDVKSPARKKWFSPLVC